MVDLSRTGALLSNVDSIRMKPELDPATSSSSPAVRPCFREVLLPLGIVVAVLGWAYSPNLKYLSEIWWEDQNYSHGFLVLPIALVILWRRLSSEPEKIWALLSPSSSLSWWGWPALVLVLALRIFLYEYNFQWSETATIVPAIACLIWTLGGWTLARQVWPAVAFLLFMLPLPPTINTLISLPLQRFAAVGSCFFFQLSGIWSISEGNAIKLSTPHGDKSLEVAAICSGLRMLMTLGATVTATIILIRLPNWKRIILLVSAVPIALVCNIFRIVVTGWCYYLTAEPQYQKTAHDLAGLTMMPLALVLVGLELLLLSWLVPEEESKENAVRPIPPVFSEKKS